MYFFYLVDARKHNNKLSPDKDFPQRSLYNLESNI